LLVARSWDLLLKEGRSVVSLRDSGRPPGG
jgi:hypothetical protein